MMYGLQGHSAKMSLVQKSSETSVEQSFLRGVPEKDFLTMGHPEKMTVLG
jgi:hypothetical protein